MRTHATHATYSDSSSVMTESRIRSWGSTGSSSTHLLGEADADRDAVGRQLRQEAVVEPATLAEPPPIAGEGEAGHDHDVDRGRIDGVAERRRNAERAIGHRRSSGSTAPRRCGRRRHAAAAPRDLARAAGRAAVRGVGLLADADERHHRRRAPIGPGLHAARTGDHVAPESTRTPDRGRRCPTRTVACCVAVPAWPRHRVPSGPTLPAARSASAASAGPASPR